MPTLRLPRRRRTRVLLFFGVAIAAYLGVLSALQLLRGNDDTAARKERGRQAIAAQNWALIVPDERAALARAIDEAWRSLGSYQARYVTGPPDELRTGNVETETTSAFLLDDQGNVSAQRDTSFISARSPANNYKEERLEGYRIRATPGQRDSKGRLLRDVESIYQKEGDTWRCERHQADPFPPVAPGLDLTSAGDGGFSEIDGHPVRAFIVPSGAFQLRRAATVWIDTESLHIRRQTTESVLKGRQEVWTYSAFDAPVDIRAPLNVPCADA